MKKLTTIIVLAGALCLSACTTASGPRPDISIGAPTEAVDHDHTVVEKARAVICANPATVREQAEKALVLAESIPSIALSTAAIAAARLTLALISTCPDPG